MSEGRKRPPHAYEKLLLIDQLKKETPYLMEVQAEMAKVRKACYDAHLAEGFTEQQALYIAARVFS